MNKRDEQGLVVLLVAFVLAKLENPLERAEQALEDAGAKAYEWLHPSQRGHMDDRPGHQWTKQALMSLAARHGFPDPLMAAAIMLAESGGVPGALGDSRESVGLFQIHMPSWPQFNYDDMRDPEKNAAAAMVISKQGTDWRPWSTYRSGAYKRFL